MKLKNILIVVKDIEKSKQFYNDLFGLDLVLDNDGNMILTEGLVLQDEKIWKKFLGKDIIPKSNSCELYFEERDIEAFVEKLERSYPSIQYANKLMTHSWGQKVVRFYDLDGNYLCVDTLPYKIDQMLFLGEGREIWARSVIDHEDGYVMNCFDHNKLVAQYHPYHYENGATVHFWESPFVLFKVFKENVYAHIMYNDTIYAIICIHIQMALLHQALHGFVLTNMYVLLVIVLRSHVEECLEG